jgi:hypothetical protein
MRSANICALNCIRRKRYHLSGDTMRSIAVDFISAVKQMNKISKKYIRFGNPLIFTCLVLAVFCRLSAGFIGVFDNMIFLSSELFELFKNLICSIYVPALIIELVRLVARYDGIN